MRRDLTAVVGGLACVLLSCGGSEAPLLTAEPAAAPTNTPTDANEGAADPDAPEEKASRQSAVYSAVLQRYLREDLSIGGPDRTGVVHIVASAGLDQASTGDSGAPIDAETRRAVASQLGSQYRVRWVADADEVNLTGRTDCQLGDTRDVLISLGEVRDRGQRVTMTLDGASDCGLAGGWTYRLELRGETWEVVKHRANWQT